MCKGGLTSENTQGCDLAAIFGGFGQNEKLSEIKPPLKIGM